MANYSGKCEGGPFDGGRINHPETRFALVWRSETGRVQPHLPGYEPAEGDRFGAYTFEGSYWKWSRTDAERVSSAA